MVKFSNLVQKEMSKSLISGKFETAAECASLYGIHPNYLSVILRNSVREGYIKEDQRQEWIRKQKSLGGRTSKRPSDRYLGGFDAEDNPYRGDVAGGEPRYGPDIYAPLAEKIRSDKYASGFELRIYPRAGETIGYVNHDELGYVKSEEFDLLKKYMKTYPVAG